MNDLKKILDLLRNEEFDKALMNLSQYDIVDNIELLDRRSNLVNRYKEATKDKSVFVTNHQKKAQFTLEFNEIILKIKRHELEAIKSIIAKGETKKAIKYLLENTRQFHEKEHSEIIVLSNQYEYYLKEKRLDLGNDQTTLNKINFSLIGICDTLSEKKTILSESFLTKKDRKFIKVILSFWVLGFSIGLLFGKYNSPNFDTKNAISIYIAKKILYSYNTGDKNFENIISEIFVGEDVKYFGGDINTEPYSTPNIDTSHKSIPYKRHKFYLFNKRIRETNVKCGIEKYSFDIDNNAIKKEWDPSKVNDIEIPKNSFTKQNWIDMLALMGIINSYNQIKNIKLKKTSRARYFLGSTIAVITGFGVGYILTYNESVNCDNEIFNKIINDQRFWKSILKFNTYELKGKDIKIVVPDYLNLKDTKRLIKEMKLDMIVSKNDN